MRLLTPKNVSVKTILFFLFFRDLRTLYLFLLLTRYEVQGPEFGHTGDFGYGINSSAEGLSTRTVLALSRLNSGSS